MAGEESLKNLLQSISPVLIEGDFVFCSIKNSSYGAYAEAKPIASFLEAEGLSLVLPKQSAQKLDLEYEGIFRCISLGVHSSLKAVGLTAVIADKLAEQGISANVIAAYFHDHIFVQTELADTAIDILSRLQIRGQKIRGQKIRGQKIRGQSKVPE